MTEITRGPQYCPRCGAKTIDLTYPKRGGDDTHNQIWKCSTCAYAWHHRRAGGRQGDGLRSKFTVLKDDGTPVEAPSFVLVLTDPAARAAARTYAAATMNAVVAQELRGILRSIESRPQSYPEPGSEGRLNADIKYRAFEQPEMSVVVIQKPCCDE